MSDYEPYGEEWYKKLEDDGFSDLEKQNHSKYESYPLLLRTAGLNKVVMERQELNRKGEYFYLAEHYLYDGDFTNTHVSAKTAMKLWALHAEGYSSREIAEMSITYMKDGTVQICNQSRIKKIFSEIKHKMLTGKPKEK